jgi:hypothetical protein
MIGRHFRDQGYAIALASSALINSSERPLPYMSINVSSDTPVHALLLSGFGCLPCPRRMSWPSAGTMVPSFNFTVWSQRWPLHRGATPADQSERRAKRYKAH